MRTIPQVRARLIALASEVENLKSSIFHATFVIWAKELRELAEDTKRRPYIRKAKKVLFTSSTRLEDIREWASAFPEASYQDMAQEFKTTTGRVSEALRGKREDAPHTFDRHDTADFREAAE